MTLFTLLSGLAIFLYSMHALEAGIRSVSGEGLNRWIVARTNNPVSSAGCGVLVTAILQSSSMVSLVVLAFVSAGVMPLYNGIGVVLGANLGTTFTGWLVTVIGFKMNLQALIIPLLGLGAAGSLGYISNQRIAGIGKALFAFGLLIFGLDVMKDSVAGLSEVVDLSAFKDTPAWVYLICGALLAAVMQSSSAVMIIALSLLNSDMVQLTDAAAVVIGADLGTTSTTVLGSIGESMIKKQLAFAHVLFNVLVDSMAFLLLLPALPWFLNTLSISDPMFGLVAFHSSFNFIGMLIFLPVLRIYTTWIQALLPAKGIARAVYFDVPVEVPAAALDSLSHAHQQLSSDTLRLSWQGLQLKLANLQKASPRYPAELMLFSTLDNSYLHNYQRLKVFEGDFVHYAAKLRRANMAVAQDDYIALLVESARSFVYASKTLKDVSVDFVQLQLLVTSPLAMELWNSHVEFLEKFYTELIPLLLAPGDPADTTEHLAALSALNNQHHQHANELITRNLADDGQTHGRLSTWFNLNHELHHYARYMLGAVVNTTRP